MYLFTFREEGEVEDLVLNEEKHLEEVIKGKVSVEVGHIFNLKEGKRHSTDSFQNMV